MRNANMNIQTNKTKWTLSREFKQINKMSNKHIINQTNTVESDQIKETKISKRINNNTKMNTKYIKNKQITVTSDHNNQQQEEDCDLSHYYKPSRNYDNGPNYQLPDNFISKNGKFDTSKRYWGLKNNKWMSNRKYDNITTHKVSSKYNKKGKLQGDKIKYTPNILKPLIFKKHDLLPEEEEKKDNKFWADFDEIPDNDMLFLKPVNDKYKQFLKDRDDEFDEIINDLTETEETDDDITDTEVEFNTTTEINLSPIETLIKLLGNTPEDEILRNLLNPRTTQGFSIAISYLSEAITAVSSTLGIYYGYKMLSGAATVVNTMDPSRTLTMIKDYMLDLMFILITFSKYYQGTLTFTDASLLMVGYFTTKTLLTGSISNILDIFMKLVPAQSNTRHTQGVDITTFTQGVISIIGAFFLGDALYNFNTKNVLTAVKSLGSMLLTVKTTEAVIVAIIQMLPDIIMNIICEAFPTIGMYINVTTNPEFKNFMDDTVKMYNMGYLRILYHSHHLTKFLSRYTYMKERILTDDNMSKGMDSVIGKYIKWYDTLYRAADKLGLLPGKRHMPYVVWLCGEPGVGKSTLAKHLATTFVKGYMKTALDADIPDDIISSYVYSHSTSNKYFDGYHNQPVFILNDYLQFTTEQEEQWLIKFVDTIDLPLEVSSVDNIDQGVKGEVRFTSKILIITSNTTYLSSSKNITDVDAFNRRRDLVIKMLFKENRTVDLENFNYSWIDFHIIPNLVRHIGGPALSVYTEVEPLLENMLLRYNRFLLSSGLVLDATKCNFKDTNALQDKVDEYHTKIYFWQELLIKVYNNAKESLLKILFKIKNYVFTVEGLLKLCMVGGTAYLGYKTYCANLIKDNITQSMSGDVSTHKYKPDRTPLKRYTMGISDNIQDLCVVAHKNMCDITTIIKTTDGRVITQTMWGLFVGGSLLITPKHLWKRGSETIKIGDHIIIKSKGITHTFTYTESDLYMDPDRDIACYNTCNRMPLVKSIEHLLMDETTQVYSDDNNGFLIIPVKETIVTHNINAFIRHAPYIDQFGGKYEGKEIWQYNVKTMQGDCGSVMVLSTGGKVTICGIHVAGDSYSGNSEILDKLFVNDAKDFFTRKTQGFATDAVLEDEEFYDAVSDLDEGFIFLGKTINCPFQNTKTSIVKGPFFEVLQEHLTEPAVLQPSDPRMPEVMSPMIKSVKKFGEQILPFDEDLMNRAFNIVKTFYEPIKMRDLRVYDHNDSINSKFTPSLEKLDIKTSAGYPWSITKKGKKDLISSNKLTGELTIGQELQSKLNTCENLLNKKTMFPYTLTTTLKDERVALEKIKIGKTRTFMNFPVEYTILMRKYFDGFIDAETNYAMEIGTTVGINIYSNNWNNLYNELLTYDYHLDGDFKSFDGTIRPEFFRYYTRLVNSFYNDEYYNHRALLVNGCCFAPIFVLDKVYMKMKGNPSGSRITTSFNSFTNRMYVVMSMLMNLPNTYHTSTFFKTNIKIYAHGDDHLIGFNNIVEKYWDGLKLRDFMEAHNITYTSSKKDQPLVPFCPLHECFYLKSHFVNNGRKMMCGLDKTVIQEMVSWQRDETLVSTKMILQTALRYAYFWGEEYFKMIRGKLIQASKQKKIYIELPYYEDLENEYEYNGQMEFNYTKF